MKLRFLGLLLLASQIGFSANAAPVLDLRHPSVGINNYGGSDPHNGRGVVFLADQTFTMHSFLMDAQWGGLYDFTLDVYDWNGITSRGGLISSTTVSDVADPGGPDWLKIDHIQTFTASNRYEVIVRYTSPGVGFNYQGWGNDIGNPAGGFDVGGFLTVLDGTDFNNSKNNFWLAGFQMDLGPSVDSVPAPGALMLLGLGLFGMGLRRRIA